jgi:hypothetical protein
MPKHCQGAVRAPVGLAKFIKHKKLAELFPNKPSEAFHYRISDAGNPKQAVVPKETASSRVKPEKLQQRKPSRFAPGTSGRETKSRAQAKAASDD